MFLAAVVEIARATSLGRAIVRARVRSARPLLAWKRVCAAACLLAAVVGTLSGVLPSPAQGEEAAVGLRARFAGFRPGAPVTVRTSSTTVTGTFLALVGDWDSTRDDETGYESWRQSQGPDLPRYGALLTLALASRDTTEGFFMGTSDGSLALRRGAAAYARAIALDSIVALSPAATGAADWPAMRDQLRGAPSVTGVKLAYRNWTIIVPRHDIQGVEPGPAKDETSMECMTGLGVVAVIIACGVLVAGASNSSSSCSWPGSDQLQNVFSSCDMSSCNISRVENRRFPAGSGATRSGARALHRAAVEPVRCP
jgi:hypothetical protein